ncbi:MAG: FkbM family methyltransferase [Nitrospira sp.]|nr:FkbM family methyltransferase [Nitrospira sp.]MDH4302482.1 FkbM family methyltransferase [Nitrospira sp.]MDH5192232.1 FkbM family methyltransferase [Nitrospira sp.]
MLLKTLAKHVMSSRTRQIIRASTVDVRSWWELRRSAQRERQIRAMPPGSLMPFLGYRVRINDGPNFAVLYHDIVVRQIYGFQAKRMDPVILDCGSNIGASILYFKSRYPNARIVGFEPDPAVLQYLQENLSRNDLTDVRIVQAAVGGREGTLTFYSDGKYGSCLAHLAEGAIPVGWTAHPVPCVRLRDYLGEPIDFIKMNIEGAEWESLADCGERLRLVREMAIEYHHLPSLPRTLHKILNLLDEMGFDYVVSDFDLATYSGARPPIVLDENTAYFRQIYAKRREDGKAGL